MTKDRRTKRIRVLGLGFMVQSSESRTAWIEVKRSHTVVLL